MQKKGLLGLIADLQEVLACLVQLAAFPGAASKSPGSNLTSHQPRGRTCAVHSHSKGGDCKEAFKEPERKEVGDLELKEPISCFLSEPCWIKPGWKWFSSAGCSMGCVKCHWQIWLRCCQGSLWVTQPWPLLWRASRNVTWGTAYFPRYFGGGRQFSTPHNDSQLRETQSQLPTQSV